MQWMKMIIVFLVTITLLSCGTKEYKEVKESKIEPVSPALVFNPDTLKIPDKGGRKLKGQVLYMPIYLNIPSNYKQLHNLSAFLAIHNTDLNRSIKITKVDYFNTDGKLQKCFINDEQLIKPLATAIYTISKGDQSGTGANFLVEWLSDQAVSAPLIESVMTDLSGNLGLSILSSGRIIREIQ